MAIAPALGLTTFFWAMGDLEWRRKGGAGSGRELLPCPLPQCTLKHPQATTLCGTVWLGPVVCSDLGGNYSVWDRPARCLLQTVVQAGRAATLSGIAQGSTHLLGLDQNLNVLFGRKKSQCIFPSIVIHCFSCHIFSFPPSSNAFQQCALNPLLLHTLTMAV